MNDALDAPHAYARSVPARWNGSVRTSFYLTMRDGVRIAIDLHLPRHLGGIRIPAIVRQTRYFRRMKIARGIGLALAETRIDPINAAIRRFLVARGYAWLDVDVRGSGASSGTWPCPWSPDEVADGAEIAEWIVAQPWSSGTVGATGNSYDGTAAEMLGTAGHPAVRAIAPRCSLFDVFTDNAFPGGLCNRWFLRTWNQANHALDANRPERIVADVLGVAFAKLRGPWKKAVLERVLGRVFLGVRPVDADPREEELAAAIAEHASNVDIDALATGVVFRDDARDSPLGTRPLDVFNPATYVERLRASGAAVLGIGGWLDGPYPHAAIKRHLTLDSAGSRLLVGPWNHGVGWQSSPHARERKVRFDLAAELLRFFDEHLKGADTGLAHEPRVRWFTMGAERWREGRSWPPDGLVTVRFFLGRERSLARATSEADRGVDAHVVDRLAGSGPASRWRTLISPLLLPDYPDRIVRDERLLVYASAPLESDLEVTGHPLVTLFLRASAADGALFVYLEEETADGRVLYVTEGQLRLIHHRVDAQEAARVFRSPAPYRTFNRADAAELVVGETTRVVLDLIPTSYLFARGSRIRLAIGGADADHFDPVPNASRELAFARGPDDPSCLELPVVPR